MSKEEGFLLNLGGFVGFFIRLECAAENLKLIVGQSMSVRIRMMLLV